MSGLVHVVGLPLPVEASWKMLDVSSFNPRACSISDVNISEVLP